MLLPRCRKYFACSMNYARNFFTATSIKLFIFSIIFNLLHARRLFERQVDNRPRDMHRPCAKRDVNFFGGSKRNYCPRFDYLFLIEPACRERCFYGTRLTYATVHSKSPKLVILDIVQREPQSCCHLILSSIFAKTLRPFVFPAREQN